MEVVELNQEDTRPVTQDFVKNLVYLSKSIKEEERNKAESILKEYRYNKNIYVALLEYSVSNLIDPIQDRKQSLLLLKIIVKKELAFYNASVSATFSQYCMATVSSILSILKEKVLYILINNHILDNQLKPLLREITILISNKFFPNNWNELHEFFYQFFNADYSQKLQNKQNFESIIYIISCFYSIVKEFNKKKTTIAKNKYYPYKQKYMEYFEKYYASLIKIFRENLKNINDIDFILYFLKLLTINDNALSRIIDVSYYQSEFHKDEKLLNMINIIINKINYVIELIAQVGQNNQTINNNTSNSNKQIINALQKNLYKLIKNCGSLQASNPILFYKNLDNYTKILITIIENCEHFTEEVLKASLFSLNKIINTSIYKDPFDIEDQLPLLTNIKNNADVPELTILKTPEKKKNSGIIVTSTNNLNTSSAFKHFTSPSKYKNFDTEIKNSKKCFMDCFNNDSVNNLIECLIGKCPFIFPKENDNEEIEILTELEEVDTLHSNTENNFSSNIYTFEALYKTLLESFIINFTDLSLTYIKDKLGKLYQIGKANTNYLQTDSFFNFVNILPSLYKSKIISITDMIDSNEYITYMEQLIKNSSLILKRYINTLSKWSVILMSNETIFKYINNLIMFISNVNDPYTLIQSSLCLKNILDSIDKHMTGMSESINTAINKEKFAKMLKDEVNWGYLLCLSTNTLKKIIPLATSSELITALVKFFTSLLQKSHYQNNGDILKIIRDSNLYELTINSKDELTENIYIDMYKNLLCTLSDSSDIVQMALMYSEYLIKKNITIDNVNFLLFIVKIVTSTNEIKNLIYNFIKTNYNLFLINTNSQGLVNILVNILEEVVLFDLFNDNDIDSVIQIIYNKYTNTYNVMMDYVNQVNSGTFENLLSPTKRTYNLMLTDLFESKKILLSACNTILLYYTSVKNSDISPKFRNLLKILFSETKSIFIIKENNFLWEYSSSLLQIIERICIYNFNLFQDCLAEFLKEINNYSVDDYFSNLFNLMDETLDVKIRKINVVFICKLIPLLNYNFLLNNSKHIFDICVNLVHSELTKQKYEKNNPSVDPIYNSGNDVKKNLNNNFNSVQLGGNVKAVSYISNYNYKNSNNIKKRLNLKMSERKDNLIENDELIKSDVLSLFVCAINLKCEGNNISIQNFLSSAGYINNNKLKEIFNINY